MLSDQQIVMIISAIGAIGSNSIFYLMYKDEMRKRDERERLKDSQYQDTINDCRKERDTLMEMTLELARDKTKPQKP